MKTITFNCHFLEKGEFHPHELRISFFLHKTKEVEQQIVKKITLRSKMKEESVVHFPVPSKHL